MKGPSLEPVIRDRRLWVFLGLGALSGIVGFKLIPGPQALDIVTDAGYWFTLASFILFVASLWFAFKEELKAIHWRRLDYLTLGVIAICGVVLLVHEAFGFKIVMDEIMLLGTSMSMHLNRLALVPMRGNDVQGIFAIAGGTLDKRPLFFPFLLSVLHDLTGYRPQNAFILNAILMYVLLGLTALLGRKLAGRNGGLLGVLLWGGFPLLAQNATGGGFDLLNIVMILATLLLGARLVEKRDDISMCAFSFSALLMVQVRYESGIFMVPVAALVLWLWWREGRAILPLPVLLVPILIIILPLHQRIFQVRDSSWQLMSKPEYSKPFSLGYVPDNLAHAYKFFFGAPTDQPNSLYLSSVGVLAVGFTLLLLMRRLRTLPTESAAVVSTSVFMAGFALQFLLMMAYFWGKFDDPVIRRLSLPTHLGLVVCALYVLPEFAKTIVPKLLIAGAALALLVQGVPSMAAHAYNQEYLAGLETAWRRDFIAAHPKKDYLVIDNDSVLWISHLVSSTPVNQALIRKDSIIFHEKNRTFSEIYVFQRFTIDPDTGKMTIRPDDDLGPSYVLEPVTEQRLQMLTLSRISRVKEIKVDGGPPVKPDDGSHVTKKTPKELEEIREQYIANFLRNLP